MRKNYEQELMWNLKLNQWSIRSEGWIYIQYMLVQNLLPGRRCSPSNRWFSQVGQADQGPDTTTETWSHSTTDNLLPSRPGTGHNNRNTTTETWSHSTTDNLLSLLCAKDPRRNHTDLHKLIWTNKTVCKLKTMRHAKLQRYGLFVLTHSLCLC